MRHLILALFSCPFLLFAQIPPGYYNSAQGLTGDALKVALHNIIDNHTVISYNGLWNAYGNTDRKANGKIWDIYSDVPGGTPPYQFTYSSDQCGTYSSEGDCYNREHTWPQSWFNSVSGPTSDLFHVYPTDGKVNGERDNFPYGNVGTTTYFVSENGSKLGISVDLGYNLVVFEPIDAYKGDVARNYFYMSTRYYSEYASWTNSGATLKSEIKDWQLNVLLSWHHEDPVSTKEIDRNNAIYSDYQHNRNPFIDHPEWADSIWQERVNNFLASVGLEEQETTSIALYPNPAREKFFLDLNEASAFQLEIRDIHGRSLEAVLQQENGMFAVDCSNWENGVYVIQLRQENSIRTFRFVKE